MKFLSKANFEYIWNYLKSLLDKKVDTPEGGKEGQALVKTATGAEWADRDEAIASTDIDDMLKVFDK